MLFERIFARLVPSLSNKNAGTAALSSDVLFLARASFSSCAAMVFLSIAFSLKRFLLKSLARNPWTFLANLARSWTDRASFFRRRSGASSLSPCLFRCCSMCSCWGIFVCYLVATAASERSPGVAPRGLQAAQLSRAHVLTASAGYDSVDARVCDRCGDFLLRCRTCERPGELCIGRADLLRSYYRDELA